MSIDPYAPCPCGSGKKVKFCCSDLVSDIEKIHRMIEGDQPRGALRHVDQTLAKHKDRASLLDLKSIIELSLDDLDAARSTIDRFIAAHPDSPSAMACQAMLLTKTEGGRASIAPLQRALELLDRDMPQRVLEAIGAVGHALLLEGFVVSAQAHLWLYASIAPRDDTRALELLSRLNQFGGLPLLLRDPLRLRAVPPAAPWRDEAVRAMRLSEQGRWQQAVQLIDGLGQQYGAEPALVYNRAVLGGWLADQHAMVAGFHAYAQFDVPLDDAVEAEAIAQLLDEGLKDATIDTVRRSYAVNDLEQLEVRLADDRRTEPYEVDPTTLAEGAQQPRHSYLLMDRPAPESGASLERDQVPHVNGFLSVYGRRTDQAERLVLVADRNEQFDATARAVEEITGDSLGHVIDEQTVGKVSATERALSWRWHFPPDTPPDRRRELLDAERHDAIVQRWPDVPRPALAGKSPREAADDPQLRIPLMAAVLLLEQGSNNYAHGAAIQELRSELALPQLEPIEGDGEDIARLPLVRLTRLSLAGVSDRTLAQLYHRAAVAGAAAVLRHLAEEVVHRPSLVEHVPPEEAYHQLVSLERDPAKALAWIREARQRAEADGSSTAPWELAELELHITEGASDEAKRVLKEIEAKHMNDPEVAAALYRLLYATGVIPREDQSAGAVPEGVVAQDAKVAPVESESGRIWTPDSEGGTGKKQALWTPS